MLSYLSSRFFGHWSIADLRLRIEPRRPAASRHGLPEEQGGNSCGDHGAAREKSEESEEPTDCNSSRSVGILFRK